MQVRSFYGLRRFPGSKDCVVCGKNRKLYSTDPDLYFLSRWSLSADVLHALRPHARGVLLIVCVRSGSYSERHFCTSEFWPLGCCAGLYSW
jgi:hypothetical protein